MSQLAPENYVAGLGRGATGFTTRSDLGPAREGPSDEQIKEALAKRAAALGSAPPTAYGVSKKKQDEEPEDDQFANAENEEGLFATGNYDRDDEEADQIYKTVDERMDKRRKARRLVSTISYTPLLSLLLTELYSSFSQRTDADIFRLNREAREREAQDEYERKNPKIQQQFVDLKRALGTVSDEDWANIPEVGDLTGKNRRTKQAAQANRRFFAVPDSVLAGARDASQLDTEVQDDGMADKC